MAQQLLPAARRPCGRVHARPPPPPRPARRSHAQPGGAAAAVHRGGVAPRRGAQHGPRVQVGGRGWGTGRWDGEASVSRLAAPCGALHAFSMGHVYRRGAGVGAAGVAAHVVGCTPPMPPRHAPPPRRRPRLPPHLHPRRPGPAPSLPPGGPPAPARSRCIDPADRRRIERLEIFDEFEEWHLMQAGGRCRAVERRAVPGSAAPLLCGAQMDQSELPRAWRAALLSAQAACCTPAAHPAPAATLLHRGGSQGRDRPAGPLRPAAVLGPRRHPAAVGRPRQRRRRRAGRRAPTCAAILWLSVGAALFECV